MANATTTAAENHPAERQTGKNATVGPHQPYPLRSGIMRLLAVPHRKIILQEEYI